MSDVLSHRLGRAAAARTYEVGVQTVMMAVW